QGILNSIPGYVIRGENANALNQFRNLVRSLDLVQPKFRSIAKNSTDPWYGITLVKREQLLSDIRQLFVRNYLHPTARTRCVGFKEIRFGLDQVDDLAAYLDFVEETFPGACFIFNVRAVADTARSGWWADRADAAEYLQSFRDRMAD